jgi:regulator of sigma E protease
LPSLIALFALGLAVALHELGHLLGGLLFGLRASRIALGMGPPLLKLERRRKWVLGAIPLGASVELVGMNPHEESPAPAWRRFGVLAFGPVGNFLLALLLLTTLYAMGTHVPVPMTVGVVEPASEAARAQLRPGDVIVSFDDALPHSWSDLVRHVEERPGQPVRLTVRRAGRNDQERLTVTPTVGNDGRGQLGVRQQYVFRRLVFGDALAAAADHERHVFAQLFGLARDLVVRRGTILTPTSIVHTTSEAAASGWDALVRVLATLSVALGLFHLLPLPSLDGSRLLLTGFELATGHQVPPRLETLFHALGFVALLGLIALVAYRDVQHVIALARG